MKEFFFSIFGRMGSYWVPIHVLQRYVCVSDYILCMFEFLLTRGVYHKWLTRGPEKAAPILTGTNAV